MTATPWCRWTPPTAAWTCSCPRAGTCAKPGRWTCRRWRWACRWRWWARRKPKAWWWCARARRPALCRSRPAHPPAVAAVTPTAARIAPPCAALARLSLGRWARSRPPPPAPGRGQAGRLRLPGGMAGEGGGLAPAFVPGCLPDPVRHLPGLGLVQPVQLHVARALAERRRRVEPCACEEHQVHRDVVGHQFHQPAAVGQAVVGLLPFHGELQAGDGAADLAVEVGH